MNRKAPALDAITQAEIIRYQKLFPRKTVIEIAEHFRLGSSTGIRQVQAVLCTPEMRRYRPGIEAGTYGSPHRIRTGNWA